jgi:hypothetical protein
MISQLPDFSTGFVAKKLRNTLTDYEVGTHNSGTSCLASLLLEKFQLLSNAGST